MQHRPVVFAALLGLTRAGRAIGDYWVIGASARPPSVVSRRDGLRRDLGVEDAEITCLGCVPGRGSSVRVKRLESQPLRVAGHDRLYFGPPRD